MVKTIVFREVVAMVRPNHRGRSLFVSEFPFNHNKSMVIFPEGLEALGWRALLISLKECLDDVSVSFRKQVQTLPLESPISYLQMAKLPLLPLSGACEVRAMGNRVMFQMRDLEVKRRTDFLKSCIVGRFYGEGGSISDIEK